MKKSLFFTLIVLGSFGLVSAQKAETASSFSQAELLSFKDITPVLISANKGKDFSPYLILGFTLVMNHAEGAMSTMRYEHADGPSFSEKQRSLLVEYAGKGAAFTLEAIRLMEPGKPGTPYDPANESVFSIPNVTFSVTK